MIVSGDGEGGIEMTGSMQLIREFCDLVISPEKATRTRIVRLELSYFTVSNEMFMSFIHGHGYDKPNFFLRILQF